MNRPLIQPHIHYKHLFSYRCTHLQHANITQACPVPAPHEDRKWFHKSMNRAQAEEMLKRIHADGAYLVRESPEGDQFAISFRYVPCSDAYKLQELYGSEMTWGFK